MHNIFERLGVCGVIPVVVMEKINYAEQLAETLIVAGLPCAEITFRTGNAGDVITRMAKSTPSLLIGAGTVLRVDQVKAARDAGAQFFISPGLNRMVVEYCLQNNLAVIPGVMTPTEIGEAIELGLDVVKLFPAEESGGLNYLKAVSAPYTQIKFIPTGGINAVNLLPYLKFSKVLACGGSWMVKQELVDSGNFEEIRKITSEVVGMIAGLKNKSQ